MIQPGSKVRLQRGIRPKRKYNDYELSESAYMYVRGMHWEVDFIKDDLVGLVGNPFVYPIDTLQEVSVEDSDDGTET
jgi:hypothetical protein